jgi:hypothetical protein
MQREQGNFPLAVDLLQELYALITLNRLEGEAPKDKRPLAPNRLSQQAMGLASMLGVKSIENP